MWAAESDQAGAAFGFAVATAGDVNGDGYADIIVGAPEFDNGQTGEGRACVYYGSASSLSANANWTVTGDQGMDAFGAVVSTAGDVNGDGYADIVVGAQYYWNGQMKEGRVYLYYGSSSGPSSTADWMAEGDRAEVYFGRSVSTAGDVNGDGYSDIIVGAYGFDNGEVDEGRAFVYHGSAAGLPATANWIMETDQAGAQFGWSVSAAGDVNGDGYADVIVGAHNYSNGQSMEGAAYVYHGSSSGLSATANWTVERHQASA